jgi:ribose transport system substrate-binding protein
MLLTLRQNGLAGKVKFVGFDASAELVSALEKGEVHGLVAQDPLNMGYLAVKAVADQLAGRPVQAVVDTGVHLVTPESIGSPEIKKLLRRE